MYYNKSKKIKEEFRRRAIFPKDCSLSIFAAITFNNHVRNGMVLYYYAIETETKKYVKTNFCLKIWLLVHLS